MPDGVRFCRATRQQHVLQVIVATIRIPERQIADLMVVTRHGQAYQAGVFCGFRLRACWAWSAEERRLRPPFSGRWSARHRPWMVAAAPQASAGSPHSPASALPPAIASLRSTRWRRPVSQASRSRALRNITRARFRFQQLAGRAQLIADELLLLPVAKPTLLVGSDSQRGEIGGSGARPCRTDTCGRASCPSGWPC